MNNGTKRSYTRRTSEKDERLYQAFSEGWGILHACKAAGYSKTAYYEWRKKDPDFSAACNEAQHMHTEALEHEASRRAITGIDKPVFFQGQQCGTINERSDTLIMFLLKARLPEIYRERVIEIPVRDTDIPLNSEERQLVDDIKQQLHP